jgi:hypothetical protein
VTSPLPQIAFSRIRQHESSQQRAWEELGYLLVPDVESLPPATLMERRATPDGGVEFSCTAPTGTGTWAWQAKFLFRLAGSAWGQMERSFLDALGSTPDLVRYAFLLPIDRTAPTKKSPGTLATWKQHKTKWQALASARGMTVDIAYLGESELLRALTLPHHAGAVRYFFDETLFTPEFFEQQVSREVVNLGERYDPDVHVGVDLEAVVEGACRTDTFAARIEADVKEIGTAGASLRETAADGFVVARKTVADAVILARDAAVAVARTFAEVRGVLGTPDLQPLSQLRAVLQTCSAAAQTAVDEATAAARAAATARKRKAPARGRSKSAANKHDQQRTEQESLYDAAARAQRLRAAAEVATRQIDGPAGRAAAGGSVLLEGPAGCGKSHLLGDAATGRIARGFPTLLVLGQHLGAGPLWPQIAAIIDRPTLTGDDLLGALQVAARVRGGGRALIAIDAINESDDAIAWRDRLAGWLSDIARYPWIAVVVTIRDTYAVDLLPALPAGAAVRVTHPGLAGHEEEALTRYAAKYRLRLPDVPPLLPELTNPLFLRSLCRAANARGLDAIPREARSPTWVFAGLLDAINAAISDRRRLDVDPADRLAHRAADELATAMLDQETEALPTADARAVCEALLPGRTRSSSLFEALVTEGVLLRETSGGHDGDPVDRVRFTYQRLADHLRAHVLIARNTSDDDLRTAVYNLAARENYWALQGMFEALVLIVGETRGHELADIARARPIRREPSRRPSRRRSAEAQAREVLRRVLARAFFATLQWRAPASIRDDTKNLINVYLRAGVINSEEWLQLLLSLACVPGHPLNARWLDAALRRMAMPERDQLWSVPLASGWWDDADPVARTIDWVWSPTTRTGDDVAELAATLLAWLFAIPNRRVRDTATKALIRLLDDRTRLAANLVLCFADVDDLYVIERVVAVACGHALRRRHDRTADPNDLAALGEAVYDAVFARDPTPTHLLLRHYARTTIEAVDQALRRTGRTIDRELAIATPPHQSDWPLTAPKLRDLAARYGRDDTKYLTPASLVGHDFMYYTIERGISTDFVLPDQPRRLAARRSGAMRRFSRAVADARATITHPDMRRGVDAAFAAADADPTDPAKVRAAAAALRAAVPSTAAAILDRLSTAVRDARDDKPVRPDPDLLGRWVANRVLELGWTPDRFKDTDEMLGRWHWRQSDVERVGKKYTWIAFYELLGRLADHCPLQEQWNESVPEPYDDPWQILHAPDLDPSLASRGDEPPEGTAAARLRSASLSRERVGAWWTAGYDRTVSSDRDGAAWLHDTSDIPEIAPLLSVTDPAGHRWLVLESHATWRTTDPAADPTRDDRHMWVRTQSHLIQRTDLPKLRVWAKTKNWMGLWMPTPTEHPTGFVGGYPDIRPWPQRALFADGEQRRFTSTLPDDPPGWQRTSSHSAPDRPFALATAGYTVYPDRDRSAVDLPRAILPAPALIELLDATWTGGRSVSPELGLGELELDYSWQAGGRVVAFSSSGRTHGSAMLVCVRADELGSVLDASGLALWSWVLGEKIYWRDGQPSADRAEVYAAAENASEPVVWGRTVEHHRWAGDKRIRRRLLIERP